MVISSMEKVLGKKFDVLRLSGGGSKSDLWNRVQADIYGRIVERLKVSECTTLGAVILGAVGCGIFDSVEDGVEQMVHTFDQIDPIMDNNNIYEEEYNIFKNSLASLIDSGVYEALAKFQQKYWK